MNLSHVVILTNRLKIIPIKKEFAEDIFKELTPEITKYLSFESTGIIGDTLSYIASSQLKIQKREEMPVAMFNKTTNEFIGCGGISKINSFNPELGIWIKKSRQGEGYGKETIMGLIDWIKQNLKYECISYPVSKTNTASRKLIESLGGVIAKEQVFTSPTGKILDEFEYRIYKK